MKNNLTFLPEWFQKLEKLEILNLAHNKIMFFPNWLQNFKYLKKSLIKEGFDKKAINRIYGSKRVYFETKGIYGYLVHSEARVNYKQYVSGKSIYKALKYNSI